MTPRLLAGAAALVLVASPAFATTKIFSPGFSVATVSGSVEFNASGNNDPWTAQVFTTGGECLSIRVVSQGADLEATLEATDGRIWQDDDSNGALRPRINAITQAGRRGWYPLSLHQWAGANVNADFTLTVQRNPASSALCLPTTAPRVLAAPASAKGAAPMSNSTGGANN